MEGQQALVPQSISSGKLAEKLRDWSSVISGRGELVHHFSGRTDVEFKTKDMILYCVEEITYEEDSPQLEALENALSCMTVPGVNLVYLILGKGGRVRFYFGFVRDNVAVQRESDAVRKMGAAFLKPVLEGNFRGSTIRELDADEMEGIRADMQAFLKERDHCRVLGGVPGGVKDKEKQDFRGVDRLVDIMQGDEFGFMIIAKPIGGDRLSALRRDVFSAYEMLSMAQKQSVQLGVNEGSNKNLSENKGKAVSKGTTESFGTTKGEGRSTGTSESHGGSSNSSGKNSNKSYNTGTNESRSKSANVTENTGTTSSIGLQQGTSVTVNSDLTNKDAADWVKYFDEVLIPRLDYARGKGAFVVNMTLLGKTPQVARKLSQAARSIFAGETANMVPLLPRIPEEDECKQLVNFAIPYEMIEGPSIMRLPYAQAGLLEYGGMAKINQDEHPVLFSGNWMSVRELALMAGLPQKEVVGMRLKEEVEFGLNIPDVKDESGVTLGTLVKSGTECRGCDVLIGKDQLDRHVFVAGVTGSGKTTTCQTLLLSSGWPFLVIEPAKTEYRGLRNTLCPDLLVFTLGDDTVAPFRLNPFELIPGESVTARVDMLMASISAAFDMEAAIPQLIERAIYACYEDYGWGLDTSENSKYPFAVAKDGKVDYESGPFADGVFAFPTLSDVLKKTEDVVNEQGFDERLKKDYIGSIKARLQGLTLGAKGFMLDCPRSVDFVKLLDKKVVLELESIPNASQKSLIIGFVLTNLLQAVKYKFYETGEKVNHITLIEEAHRLLSKPEPGGSPSQKQAAETFADMLAEIRKYGESLVIADQIPGKLTPEVMKNTNTKIIHRLFAQDDKEAVGHTMGLEENQAEFLSNLVPGRAVIFNGNWTKAVQVQITQTYRTDSKPDPDEKVKIRAMSLAFYASQPRRGVFGFSDLLGGKPDFKALENLSKAANGLVREFRSIADDEEFIPGNCKVLPMLCKEFGTEKLLKAILPRAYPGDRAEGLFRAYLDFLTALLKGEDVKSLRGKLTRCGRCKRSIW